jgi:hypothetical protein
MALEPSPPRYREKLSQSAEIIWSPFPGCHRNRVGHTASWYHAARAGVGNIPASIKRIQRE